MFPFPSKGVCIHTSPTDLRLHRLLTNPRLPLRRRELLRRRLSGIGQQSLRKRRPLLKIRWPQGLQETFSRIITSYVESTQKSQSRNYWRGRLRDNCYWRLMEVSITLP